MSTAPRWVATTALGALLVLGAAAPGEARQATGAARAPRPASSPVARATASAAPRPTPAAAPAAARGPARAGPAGLATVERVDWQSTQSGGRVVVTVSGAVHYSTHAASADPGGDLPARAYVDLRPARLGARLPTAPQQVGEGILQRIRVGQFDRQTVRIVVDLASAAVFDVRTADRPPRLVLRLAAAPAPTQAKTAAGTKEVSPGVPLPAATPGVPGVGEPEPAVPTAVVARTAAAASAAAGSASPASGPGGTEPGPGAGALAPGPGPAPSPSPAATPAGQASPRQGVADEGAVQLAALATPLPSAAPAPSASPVSAELASPFPAQGSGRGPQQMRSRTVVLDPGHGGKDPGARGVTGEEEKQITLAIAELVAERLRPDQALRVVLTRTDDRYVPLEQRTAIANAQAADLFVSIHGNASENPQLTGIETYTLNNTDDRATIRLAAMENGLSLTGAAPGEQDLAFILSDLLQTGKEDESVALADGVQRELVGYLRSRWKRVESLGVKKGPFYVLVGAYMPCVLVEVGFLTHGLEGERIAQRRYQRDVAEGIARGIRRFLDSAPANANL